MKGQLAGPFPLYTSVYMCYVILNIKQNAVYKLHFGKPEIF